MERMVVLTLLEVPVGDGIHSRLGMRMELHPPMTPGEEPGMAAMAAMVALDAIAKVAIDTGGIIEQIEEYPDHSPGNKPGWWPR